MARYIVRKSYVDLIGTIWLPTITCAQRKDLRAYDVENIKGHSDDGKTIDRDSVEQWLMCHSGDFSQVADFRASIEDGDQTIDLDWAYGEDSELTYTDCMCGEGE